MFSLTAAREEARMEALFPGAWRDYAARMPRLLPDPRLFRTDGEVTLPVSVLRRNFFDALVFLGFIPPAEFMEWLKDANALPSIPLW